MSEELRQEIDYNLAARDDLKDLLSRFKSNGGSVKGVDAGLIVLKFNLMEASYDDIAFYIVKLFDEGFFTNEESAYIAECMNEAAFYDDSDELKAAIAEKEQQLRVSSADGLPPRHDDESTDKYEYYILERAAYNLDHFVEQ